MAKAASKTPSKKTPTKKKPAAARNGAKSAGAKRSKTRQTRQQDDEEDEEIADNALESSDTDGGEDDAYVQDDAEGDADDAASVASLDSDALDDSDFETRNKSKKRKRATSSSPKKNGKAATSKSSPAKKRGRKSKGSEDDEGGDDVGEDGEEVVGIVVQAPKTGRVPPGRISQNTFDFLSQLQIPENNDRTWFKLHEPVYRQAEKEWKDFIDEFTILLSEVDLQIPPLPPNDVVHRIYRDMRFSNDKTPYKTALSASFSRSGRKGIFAHYHIAIKPGGGSLVAGGSWCPGRDELQTIRNHILRNPRRLREVLAAPAFVKLFGEPKARPKGGRQSIFGHEDELKNAPKGVAKDHKDIDLLKCRSFAVMHNFMDKEVLHPNFKEKLIESVKVLRPLVHLLNDMMTVEPEESDGGEDDD